MSMRQAAYALGLIYLLVMGAPTGAHAVSDDAALDALAAAYPDALLRHDGRTLIWRDGTTMPAGDDAPDKSFDDLLRKPSVLDQFHQLYPQGRLAAPPGENLDPGRFRNTALLRKLYGDCTKGEVEKQLVPVRWLPKTANRRIQITRAHGVADALAAVSREIDALPAEIRHAAYPIAGTYNCRPVADTGVFSMHAYGAAIDLNLRFSDYWLTDQKARGSITYRNRMPQEIVDIFERHGFIWGGKWYHYDTMHFEFRPELLKLKD
ncbi:MAG TPA: M15 family metallopeptidase [Pseudolabrys sp.]|nr:M15 family metallopeptidase [Pseudolabrys sp.]